MQFAPAILILSALTSATEVRTSTLPEQLAQASCNDPSQFERVLQQPGVVTLVLDEDKPCTKIAQGYWQAATRLGCARVITAPDRRLRVWTLGLETLESTGPKRGQGYLTWQATDGSHRVIRDREPLDLHLDAIIDALYPLGSDGYLVLGLRAYRTSFPGNRPRRFAYVLRRDPNTGKVSRPKVFPAPQGPQDILLLEASAPPSGKFRHHLLAHYWLRFYRGDGALVLEPVPGTPAEQTPRAPTVIASYRGNDWRMHSGWGADMRTDRW